MIEKNDQTTTALFNAEMPPIPEALNRRTLAIATAHLPPPGPRHWSLVFADYVPSPVLVPALLFSAAVVFTVDAFVKMARFLGLS